MLQNRVNPFGDIIKTSARGTMMGNRGLLHNDKKEIVRPFRLKAWITCVLDFKERKREVMTPNLYTELFFLDEATAFAAGHRPCFECRRQDYNRFKNYWLKGNPEYGFNEKTSIKEIDDIIHKERITNNCTKVMHTETAVNLPNGIFVELNNKPFLLKDGKLYLWTAFCYEKGIALPKSEKFLVITPKSIVNSFRAGYVASMLL